MLSKISIPSPNQILSQFFTENLAAQLGKKPLIRNHPLRTFFSHLIRYLGWKIEKMSPYAGPKSLGKNFYGYF